VSSTARCGADALTRKRVDPPAGRIDPRAGQSAQPPPDQAASGSTRSKAGSNRQRVRLIRPPPRIKLRADQAAQGRIIAPAAG